MIKLLVSIAIALVLSISGFAQQVQRDYNTIAANSIVVINQYGKRYSLESRNNLIRSWGKAPLKKEADEMLGGYAYSYSYKGVEFYFNEQSFESVSVKGSDITVILGKTSFKVGDKVQKLQSNFPMSYKNREVNSSKSGWIRLQINHNSKLVDTYVILSYEDGKVSEIEVSNNNS